MKRIAMCACFMAVGGCATVSSTQPIDEPVPSHLLALCGPLPKAVSGALPDLVRNHVEVLKAYAECAERHRQSVEWMTRKK